MTRNILFLGTAFSYGVSFLLFVPKKLLANSVAAASEATLKFWLTYILGVFLGIALWLITAKVKKENLNRLGLKDERDLQVERISLLAGFGLLFGGSFPGLVFMASGQPLMAFKIFSASAIAAAGALSAVSAYDAVRTYIMLRAQS